MKSRVFLKYFVRVSRPRLPAHVKVRRRYRGAPVRQRSSGIVSVKKRLLPFGKKEQAVLQKSLAKNIVDKALDKTLDIIDSLSNRIKNKTIKKVLNANLTKATVNKGTENLRRRIRNWDTS